MLFRSAKIAARIPPLQRILLGTNATDEEWWGAKVAVRPTKPLGKWSVGAELRVTEERDWTGVVKLGGRASLDLAQLKGS